METVTLNSTRVSSEQPTPVRVVVDVPLRKPGNVIYNMPIEFEIFQRDNLYTAVPRCSEEMMTLLNLAEVISFRIVNRAIVTRKPKFKQLAEDILNVMVSQTATDVK